MSIIKIIKILKDYGERIHYSVFEFNLTKAKILEMKHKLTKKKLLDKKISFSVYSICEDYYKKVERYRNNKLLDEKK